jgi:uncharacterized membrane protein (UPF0136 family)
MKPLRVWMPITGAVLALSCGLISYILLTATATIPHALRDNPWPMELAAVLATAAVIFTAVRAYREKRLRAVATVCAALATLSTAGFLVLIHVATYALPAPPKELAVGSPAPDFTLPDEQGRPVTLASARDRATLLVFYRGSW